MSRAICVLGMMRTGTSAVAGVLELLGAHFGPTERLLEPNVANPTGFREHRGILDVNNELLGRLGGTWYAPPALRVGWADDPDARRPARTRRQVGRVGSRTARRLGMEGPAHLSHAALLAGARAGAPPRCLPSGARRDRAVVRGAGRDGLDGCPASVRPVRDGPRPVAPVHERRARADTRTSATPRVLRRAGRGSARTERPAGGLRGPVRVSDTRSAADDRGVPAAFAPASTASRKRSGEHPAFALYPEPARDTRMTRKSNLRGCRLRWTGVH